jgi:ABC-2 type transport system ATP-binding protein
MTAISVKNITKKFKKFTAVDGLSFEVEKNHVVGFLGPNGAGKTTTIRMIVGLSKPTAGSISISSTPVIFGRSQSNKKVGYLPEAPAFYAWMTGFEYLSLIADIFELSVDIKIQKLEELLKLVDLTQSKDKRISTYSNGMKQRLGIAQALIGDPEVLILDEPVSALDPIGRKEVLRVIESLKKNKTIFFSTHILSDVDRICDDIILINNGKLIISSSLADLKTKYASPILEVEFNGDPTIILTSLRSEKWVSKIEKDGNQLRIWLNNETTLASNVPLIFFSKQKLGVLRYGLTLPETEDLFIRLVGGEK